MTEKIDRRRRKTQKAVLDAAEELFLESGYRAASLDAIAERADVAVSSIYFNFKGGKSDLYLALAERAAVINGEMLEPAYDDTLDPFEQLSAVGRAYVKFHMENPLALRLLSLHDVDRKGDERVQAARVRIKASLLEMLERLERLVEEALEAGGNEGTSARALTVYLFASWNGVLSMHARGELGSRNLKGVLKTGETLVIGAIRSGNASNLELERN